MTDILREIADVAKVRVEESEQRIPLSELQKMIGEITKEFPFEKALSTDGISFICEVKKASPSKGVIAQDFPYVDIAKDYEKGGASCISVLTEPKWFLGDIGYLNEISGSVSIPLLRKDFIVDEYMIYEAKVNGASAVLLICSLLDEDTLSEYIRICDSLGLSALVEAHDESEISKAVSCGARIIGVNNRNLHDFSVDVNNSMDLRSEVPDDILFVAESGIKTHDDIIALESAGVDAVLIGETVMRADDRISAIHDLRYGHD